MYSLGRRGCPLLSLLAFPFLACAFLGLLALLLEAGALLLLAGALLLELRGSLLLFASAFFCLLAFLFLASALPGFFAFPLLAGEFYLFTLPLEASAVLLLACAVLLELRGSLLLLAGVCLGLFTVLEPGTCFETGACFRLFAFPLLAGASLGRPLPILEFLL